MANQDAAFGFRQVGGLGSRPTNEGTSKYVIASGYTSAIYAGDIVEMGAGTDEGGFINPYGRCVMRRDDTMYIAKSIATGGYTAFEVRSAQTTVGSISFNSGGTFSFSSSPANTFSLFSLFHFFTFCLLFCSFPTSES